MRTHRGVLIWVILTVVFVSLCLSIIAVVIANSDVRGDCEIVYDYTKLLELTGIVFSIVGVVWTVYFVIAGINVINIQRNIQSESEKISRFKTETESFLVDFTEDLYSIYQSLFIIVNDLGQSIPASASRNKNIEKTKKDLQLIKARLGVKLKYLPNDERIEDIKYLFEKGTDSDRDFLNRIVEDPFEKKQIIDYITLIINSNTHTDHKKVSFFKRICNAIMRKS